MQYTFRLMCLVIGLLVSTLPAQAIDLKPDTFKPYAGAGLGGFIIDAGLGSETAFGGYGILGADLHENYGIELRVGATGDTGSTVIVPTTLAPLPNGGGPPITLGIPTPATIGIDWFVSYLFKLQYPVDEGFRIYGLIGGTTLKSSLTFASLGRTAHIKKTTFSYGGGIDYRLDNQWLLGVDAMVYANDASTDPGTNFTGLDVWGLTGTIKYEF
ncbi:MAG: hypothetical protein BMS9Abin18_1536 [Zetaproteobacteria bacterium]|nr:MAG: hypothetical protein BMS9Abin18_1536 [Zetaproteobacteria bacterium]